MSESQQTNCEWKQPGGKEYLSIIPYLFEVKGEENMQN